ncbi:unnamed protein product, partial [Tilletia controversa]
RDTIDSQTGRSGGRRPHAHDYVPK